jgi:uncharacterized ferritin-like protein (DUF455 family)
MAEIDANVLEGIKEYAQQTKTAEDARMDVDPSDLEARLEETIRELQDRLREQEDALEKVRHQLGTAPAFAKSSDLN